MTRRHESTDATPPAAARGDRASVAPSPRAAAGAVRPATSPPLPPLPDEPTVSVIIPARDGAATLLDAVDSVLTQSRPPDEVVIAVAPSTDATFQVATTLVRDHPERVRMVDNPTGRTPDALNVAIAAARGQVLARVDTGARLPPGYLQRAVEVLRETGAANVGGVQLPHADRGFATAVAAAMRSPAGSGGAAYRTGARSGPVDTVYLGVFRREALEAVGGFDPAFVRNQDAELNLRLRAAGFTVWLEPELAVAYRPRGSVRGLASQYWQYGRWRRRTATTHRGSLAPRQLAPVVLVVGLTGALGWSLLRRTPWPAALAGGGYAAGMAAAGAHAAPDPRPRPGPTLAPAVMHVSWGIGFLVGPPRDRQGEGGSDRGSGRARSVTRWVPRRRSAHGAATRDRDADGGT